MLVIPTHQRAWTVKFLFAAVLFLLPHFVAASWTSNDKVLLSNVNTLTLYADKKTAWRRTV